MLLDRWICAGHTSEIPGRGDYLLAELGANSAIVISQRDGSIRALANVCRHRGSRICTQPHGRTALLTCPYHAWTYDLDGALRHAAEMPPGFDPASHGLAALPVSVIGGLIFISFGSAPPALDGDAALAVVTARFGWPEARVAQRRSYAVRANWKLVLENYHECYHCLAAHPEFSELHALARPGNRQIGTADHESWGPCADGREMFRVMHSALSDGVQTGSRDGLAVAPLMGQAAYGGDCVFAELGFLSAFLLYPDYGVIYRFMPKGVPGLRSGGADLAMGCHLGCRQGDHRAQPGGRAVPRLSAGPVFADGAGHATIRGAVRGGDGSERPDKGNQVKVKAGGDKAITRRAKHAFA
jgi:Rieske 2Fe-2S family protein